MQNNYYTDRDSKPKKEVSHERMQCRQDTADFITRRAKELGMNDIYDICERSRKTFVEDRDWIDSGTLANIMAQPIQRDLGYKLAARLAIVLQCDVNELVSRIRPPVEVKTGVGQQSTLFNGSAA